MSNTSEVQGQLHPWSRKQRAYHHLRRHHRRYVLIGAVWMIASAIIFGFDMCGLGASTGVVGTVLLALADL